MPPLVILKAGALRGSEIINFAEQDVWGKWARKAAAIIQAMQADPRSQLVKNEQRLFGFRSDDLFRTTPVREDGPIRCRVRSVHTGMTNTLAV